MQDSVHFGAGQQQEHEADAQQHAQHGNWRDGQEAAAAWPPQQPSARVTSPAAAARIGSAGVGDRPWELREPDANDKVCILSAGEC